MNTNNSKWLTQHNAAMTSPNTVEERSIVGILGLIRELNSIELAHDMIFRTHFENLIKAGRSMLDLDIGRLDAAECDREFCGVADAIGYDIGSGEWDTTTAQRA
jgi:hypothetical protein